MHFGESELMDKVQIRINPDDVPDFQGRALSLCSFEIKMPWVLVEKGSNPVFLTEEQLRDSNYKHKKKSKGDKKRKRSKRDSELSDHEEVNETPADDDDDDDEENGEETLQKMKSAIISVLDDEIFALSKKKSKRK